MADYRPSAPKLQEQDLLGKVALVTGCTRGIPRATALSLATRGCSILGTYSSPQSAHLFDTLAHTISALYATIANTPPLHILRANPAYAAQHVHDANAPVLKGVVADIKDLGSVSVIVKALNEGFGGKIDIVVLGAAVGERHAVGEASENDISAALTGNVHWPVILIESLVRNNLLQPNSRIVVLSSDRARAPTPGSFLLSATKAALESLVRSWALELPGNFPGTTVNAVSVGAVDTPGLRADEDVEARRSEVRVVEGGRLGFPEEVADVVGWLVSEKSRWVTGSVVAANGGAEWVGGSA